MAQIKEEKSRYLLEKNDYLIKKTSVKFIISSVISTLFVFAGSLIDTLLVGAFLGEDGLSAMSLVSPIYLIFYTVGATVGIGGSIFASRALGRGDLKEYRRIFTLSTVVLLICAAIMVLGSYIFFDGITDLLCMDVTGKRREMFQDYFRYYIPGGAATLMTYVPLYFLKTDGRPKVSSRLFTLSAVMNAGLTALFMSPLVNMGIAGASLATSIAMGTVTVLGFIIILKGETELRFVKDFFNLKTLKETAVSGVPNGLNNLLSSARIMFMNMMLVGLSASLLSCYTVIRNVSDVLGSVILGISSAIIPLVGVQFGEKDYEGSRMTMRNALKMGIKIMIPLVLAVCLLPDFVFKIFAISDPELLREGRWALPLSCIGLIANYANTLYIGYLTAIKREIIASVMVILRLFAVLALLAFPLSWIFGSKGVWACLSLSEIVTLVIFFIISAVIRKRNPKIDKYLLDTDKELTGEITFSVKNNVDDIVFATEKITDFCDDNEISMKKSMKVSLAIEEILTFLNGHCLSTDDGSYTDVRVCKLENEVMVRFRYVGRPYDPTAVYDRNKDNEELEEELLGLKLITKSASLITYSKTLGVNNLMLIF